MILAVREGDLSKADSLNRLDNGGESYTIIFKVIDAYRRRDVAAQQKLLPIYIKQVKTTRDPLTPPDPAAMIVYMSIYGGDIRSADDALQLPVDSVGNPRAAQARRYSEGLVAIMHGQLKRAEALVSPRPHQLYAPYGGQTAFEPFRTPTRAELFRLREDALRSDSTPKADEDAAGVLAPQFRLYWAALANCRLGNISEALQQAQRMESLDAPPYWREAMHALATDVRAFADVAQGDDHQALRRIEGISTGVPIDLMQTPANRRIEMLWRGELLYRVGRYDEALKWFENLPADPEFVDVIPFYLLRRAQIHDHFGDMKKAALLYAQFLDYWKNPDPELQPLVRDARQRLAGIQGKVD